MERKSEEEIKEVERRLESLRAQMHQLAIEKDLTNPQVLMISQEIDRLHNILNKRKYAQKSTGDHDVIRETLFTPYLQDFSNSSLSDYGLI